MKVIMSKHEHYTAFSAEDGDQLVVSYDNRGEPYREGIALALHEPDRPWRSCVFLDRKEVDQLRDLIDTLFPRRQP